MVFLNSNYVLLLSFYIYYLLCVCVFSFAVVVVVFVVSIGACDSAELICKACCSSFIHVVCFEHCWCFLVCGVFI